MSIGEIRDRDFDWCARPFTTTDDQAARDRHALLLELDRRTAILTAAAHVLEIIRDADEDCHRDSLPTMPPSVRAKVDEVLTAVNGGAE